MKYSIKKQLAVTFMIILGTMQIMFWITNLILIENHYVKKKEENLLEAYMVLKDWNHLGMIDTEEFDRQIQRVCEIYNISFIIADSSSNTIKTSIQDEEEFTEQLRDIIFGRNSKVIQEEEEYTICNLLDDKGEAEYLILWGSLEDGNFFMLRSSMEGIRNSAHMANAFFLNVILVVIILAIAMIWLVSEKVANPILKLADISKRMANLDFEAKYEGNDKNEIAILGENFNFMSEKLEETICSLKNANLELKRDVENKTKMDEMRREFVANVSHELKTPIAIIQGYAEGLNEGIIEDPESQKFYCEVILDETEKMNRMVKKLITLSHLESDGEVINMERFDITSVITNCVKSVEILLNQNNIALEYSPEKEIYVWADEYQVEEVIRNYLSNAIHYSKGIIRIAIEEKESTIRVSVFNSGDRIPEESLSHLWDKFYKVDKARTREYGGSGIGLSIVKAVMERLGQDYGVENKENGVEFYFELESSCNLVNGQI